MKSTLTVSDRASDPRPTATPSGPAPLLLALFFPACGAGSADSAGAAWESVTDTLGDTVVVRTVSGSVWGGNAELIPELTIGEFEGADAYIFGDIGSLAVAPDGAIYAFDRQAKALRKYSADGEYLATFGREGGGPGEYKQPDGGLTVLSDGRVLLRDPGNARINVYSPEGATLGSWPIRGGWFTSDPLFRDTADHVYHRTTFNEGAADEGDRWLGLLRFDPSGEVVDSLRAPDTGFEAPVLDVSTERIRMRNSVPFSATEEWTFSPLGYFVHGVGDRYAVDLHRPEGVLRLARDVGPVSVDPDERANQEERTTHNMRRVDPSWRWNGPSIPDVKPPWKDVMADADGRIWVQLSRPGERIPEGELAEEGGGVRILGGGGPSEPAPPSRWREPVVWDVFEPDGRYLGEVRAAEGMSHWPVPVIRGDRVYAVMRDEMDVQYLVRYRLVPEGSRGGDLDSRERAGG